MATGMKPSQSFPSHLRETAFVAHHEESRRTAGTHEIVEVERLANDETSAMERVTWLKL